MYRIMIVDDEYYIRDGLCNVVNWASIGAECVGEASSSMMALEKIPLLKPDVILTDIRMEDMDGLQLAETVRDEFPGIRIVFLSGYDNFAYAQRAVELKADGYILKPGDPKKVLAVVREALDEIEKERGRDSRLILLEDLETESEEVRRKRLFADVLGKTYENSLEIKVQCEKLGVYTQTSLYCIAVFQPDCYYDFELIEDSRQLYAQLHKASESAKEMINSWSILYEDAKPGGLTVLLTTVRTDMLGARRELIKELYKLQARLYADSRCTYTIGLSEQVNDLFEAGQAGAQAAEYLEYKIVLGPGRIITMDNLPVPTKYVYPKDAEEQILEGIKTRDATAVSDGADAFVSELMCRNYGKTQLKIAFAELYAVVNRYCTPAEIDLYQLFDKKWMDPHYVVESYNSMEELRNWLRILLCEVVKLLRSHGQVNNKKVVLQAQAFIRANYANSNLSLSMLADHVFLNPAYLSRLYKKETGSNYVEYLTQYRMQEAKRLLSDSTLRINDISTMVGYANPQYFCTLFKKCFQVSPVEYRENSTQF